MSVTDEDVKAALESGAWTEKTDKKTGKTYYVNKATKKTCWDLKKELAKSKGGDAKEDEKKKTDKKEEKAKPEKKEAKKEKEKEPKKEKEKAEKKKEEKSEPAEADRESVASAAKPTNSSSRPKRGSMVSNVSHASNVSRMSAATERTIGGEVQPYTPIIMRSDNPHKGKYMTAVTLEVASKGVVDGPDMVYGFTEKEVKLAASLRREQMRQKYYDRMSLRSYMDDRQGGPRSGSLVEAADYWDGDMLHGGGLPCPDTRRYIAPSNMSQVTDDGGKDGALRAASACGDASGVLRLLKEGGVRVNEPRQDGKTALHHAARHGHLEVIEILLEAGADPLRPDMKGRTAVDMAAQFGQRGAVSLLENRGGGSPGRVRHHWHCSPDRLSPRSATREPSGTVYPTAYPNPVETRRQLTEDVTEAMSGMSMLVKGWINDWGKHPQESIGYPQGYREYRRGPQYDLPSETQKHPAGRISPPRNPRSPGILDELTAHIWAAANNGPQPTNIDTPPAPPPALGATTPTPIRSWGPAADTPPRAPQYPAAQAYLLPSDGIDI
eukprot:TRINITY_DN2851_c0_g1_i1.p1 TRINITY_DN2851_c0_g1~~TRINITY_DN2851_c0_g1_i1.p1  ORF type:complete len:552 (+),score=136.66 TRINITY_DN2851_c0_g1_i1:463-2118(+)